MKTILSLALLAFTGHASAALTQAAIDDFTSGPQTVTADANSSPQSSSVDILNSVFNQRTITVENVTGVGQTTAEVIITNGGFQTFSNDALTQGDVRIYWDNTDASSIDISMFDIIGAEIVSIDQGNLDLTFTFVDALANTASINSTNVGAGVITADLADSFTGVDLTQIVGAEFSIQSLTFASDLVVDSIGLSQVSLPASGGLMGLGLGLTGMVGFRRRK